jgi:hypothetical protein
MKRLILFMLVLAMGWLLKGQDVQYGNNWYKNNGDQPYLKMLVVEDGVYRVTSQQLASAGFDVSGVDPNTLRIYFRGKEVPRYISRTLDGDLNYLEFYGRHNDGRLDSLMYRNNIVGTQDASGQPDIENSLFSDTAAYFLTYTAGQQGSRYFDYLNILYAGSPEDGFTHEARLSFDPDNRATSTFVVSGGSNYDSFNALNSDYILGEGYVSRASFGQNSPVEFAISTPGALNDGTAVRFKTRVFGRSNTTHRLRIMLDGRSTALLDTSWNSNQIYVKTYTRDLTTNIPENTKLTFEALGTGPADNNHLCWASVTYRRNTNLQGANSIHIKDFDKSTDAYFRFTNVSGTDTVVVYDLTNNVRAKGIINNGTAQVIVPSFGAGNRQLYVATDQAIKTPVLAQRSLNKLFDENKGAEFIIISNKKLQSSAEAYRNYRDTASANPLSATVVYVDEIFDEFGYGSPTPWAIKRFCKYAIDNYSPAPKFFFLWGNGSFDIRGTEVTDENLVPSFGNPVTDFEFVGNYRLNDVEVAPMVPIGRVNVGDDDEGMNYLNKVIDYEYQPFMPWMKEGVFLGGGATVGEQAAIRRGIENFLEEFNGIPFGGNEVYFQKEGGPGIITGDTYHDRINEGTNIIHFFGHSSSNIQDVRLYSPDGYTNFNQYPFIIAMGCFGGNFSEENSFGEKWVKEPRRGAIGYLANSSAGYLSPLKIYGEIFYKIRYDQMPVEPIGNIIKATVQKFTDSVPGIQTRNHCRQMNLQGDPAVVLKFPTKVDLAIDETSVFFEPDNFTAQDADYTMNLIVDNLGLALEDSFTVRISQRLPDGSSFEHPPTRLAIPLYRDTFGIELANPVENRLAGRNVYDVWVDADEEFDEYLETNNRVNIVKIVPGNIPATIYPAEFAVVGEAQNHLDASAFFITRDSDVRYLFEIDTTAEFNSPAKVSSGVVTGKAGYVRWDLPFLLEDSAVYFWRVRLVDVDPSFWGNSTFRYIKDKTGWAQARAAHYEFNDVSGVSMNLTSRRWQFQSYAREFEFELARRDLTDRVFSMNVAGDIVADGIIRDNIVVSVIDQFTLETVYPNAVQVLQSPANQLSQLKSLIRNAKDGDYVMVCATKFSHISFWDEELFSLMGKIGVSGAMRSMADEPFLFFGRKGNPPGTANEVYEGSNDQSSRYVVVRRLMAPFAEAEVGSPRIGPAVSWGEAWWGWNSLDQNPNESAKLSLFALDGNGNDSLIADNIEQKRLLDLKEIDAAAYPYMRFKLDVADSTNFTAPQLNNWHIFYGAAPDAVIDPTTDFAFESDTVQEGEDIFIQLGAENVTNIDMDSLLVKFTLVREDRSRLVLDSLRTAPLPGEGRVGFSYRFNTKGKGLAGLVELQVEINPDMDQPERNAFNNLYVQPFFVNVDRTNPMIDVTFDGKHIINGDIVSPVPEIVIELKDENPFIAMDDSSILELKFGVNSRSLLQEPETISLNDPRVTFIPAELPENRARIIFRPGLAAPLEENTDGYVIQLNGADARGNTTGAFETYYEVTFKVVDESSITHVLNYPNPFSTNTRFVYTLTGSELPEVFQIHIYTISGKIVKVVDLVEMGEVKFGHNITDYAWDGSDEYGDKLANGVYLYRVILKLPTEELEVNGEATSKYFKNGWGKMYIMR